MRRVVWFSCGATSAVAAKLAVEKYADACTVVYCDTMATEHPDNARFFAEVEEWIGRKIEKVRSEKYATVDEVFERRRYMSGIAGAVCTVEMKKLPREAFQWPDDTHLFGYSYDKKDIDRAEQFEDNNTSLVVEWILIDQFVTKAECQRRIAEAGIALPAMYALGFDHNNCLGCVKATSPGYWNRTRRNFPDVFERRARQSREIGARLVRLGGQRFFLDELPANEDGPDDAIDCGPACQMPLFTEAA